MLLHRLLCIPFQTAKHHNAYDVLSGKVVTFECRLLFDIVVLLTTLKEKRISSAAFFVKYLAPKGILEDDYLAALKELRGYQNEGVLCEDIYDYSQEARRFEAHLNIVKHDHDSKRYHSFLILNITHDCNLRCHYCHFTGIAYAGARSHERKTMPFETAQKAIDYYLEHTRLSRRPIYIQFYGGEPLLEFDKIVALIKYAAGEKKRLKHKTSKTIFHIATNGTLLTEDIVMFLLRHRVHVQISIDGPRAVHDANRVSVDGQGSFDRVMKNLRMLKRLSQQRGYPAYFRNCVTINATSFDLTDSEDRSVRQFFSRSRIFKELIAKGEVSVQGAGTRSMKGDYRQRAQDMRSDKERALINNAGSWKKEVKKIKHSLGRNLAIFFDPRTQMSRKIKAAQYLCRIVRDYKDVLHSRPGKDVVVRALTGTCILGFKQVWDVDGRIYMCTQVPTNKTTLIGRGSIDFSKVKAILRSHVLDHGTECRSCPIFPFCQECVAHSVDDNGFLRYKRDDLTCRSLRSSISERLSFIYSLIENFPEFECFIRKEYRRFKKYISRKI